MHNIDWNIGSLFIRDDKVIKLLDECNYQKINHNIKYVFGSIPCIMQGGRISFLPWTLEDAFKIIDEYNSRNIGCRLTFSNNLLTKEDLKDYTSNKLLEYINKTDINGVIISSDLLVNYIKAEYPNLQTIASQIKPSVEVGLGDDKDTVNYYNKLFDMYDIVVINPAKIYNDIFLKNIKCKNRVEFIVNHRCHPNCQKAKYHYEYQIHLYKEQIINGMNVDYYNMKLNDISMNCESIMNHDYKGIMFSQHDIEKLIDFGFIHFKLEGRHLSNERFFQDLDQYILSL